MMRAGYPVAHNNMRTERTTPPNAYTLVEWIEKLGDDGKYDQQAQDFLAETDTEYRVRFVKLGRHFDSDKEDRAVWEVKLSRKGREYVFTFGDSLVNTWTMIADNEQEAQYLMREWNKGRELFKKVAFEKRMADLSTFTTGAHYLAPSAYSVLACLQAYEPPATFEDFIAEYGYEITSKDTYENAQRTYEAVKNEYAKLCTLYSDAEMEALSRIA